MFSCQFDFTTKHKITDIVVYQGTLHKGTTLILMGATLFLPADCPMGILTISVIVKAWLHNFMTIEKAESLCQESANNDKRFDI